MSLGQIGQNGVEEFLETIFYGVAYETAKDKVSELSKDVDNELLKDALESASSIIVSGVMFQLMRTQENFIDNVFTTSRSIILALIGSTYATKMKGKLLGKLKGVRLLRKLNIFKSASSDNVAVANVVSNMTGHHFQADSSITMDSNRLNTSTAMKATMIEKEKLSHSVAMGMTSNFNETLMLKMATKSFSVDDKAMLKKIIGKDINISIEDMNKVSDFMFVKDNNGEITGLSEQLFAMINGMGYINK